MKMVLDNLDQLTCKKDKGKKILKDKKKTCTINLYILRFIICVSLIKFLFMFLQELTAVFMKNCMLHYAMFRDIFPMWALAEYRRGIMLPSIDAV